MVRFPVFYLLFMAFISVDRYALSTNDKSLEKNVSKRVYAHLLIGDSASAYAEAFKAIRLYPNSKIVWQSLIRASAKLDEEKTMMLHWQLFIQKFPEERQNKELLECLAWGVIEKGAASSSPLIRVTAMLGGFFSQDTKGVAILKQGLKDENYFLRTAAIKLSSALSDYSLQEELLHLFKTDKVWRVRMEAIKAIGQLRMSDAKEDLIRLIQSKEAHGEEQAAAIHALVTMSEGISKEQLIKLVSSNRVGMRLLACEYIAFFEQTSDLDLLFPLLLDSQADVRAKLFQTLGRLRASSIAGHSVKDLAFKGVADSHPHPAISAAWLLTLFDQYQGECAFEKWLNHPMPHVRHLAAAALAATGKYGMDIALKYFLNHEDPYVNMNLALGLIAQRVATGAASHCLYKGLAELKEKWMRQEDQFFRVLSPSKVKHEDTIPDYPEAVNQLVRLEILQMLCLLNYPHSQQAIRSFLQEHRWEISGLASALLLTEGDESAIDIVRELLNDQEATVRIQAALILALWGKEEQVVHLLQDYYEKVDRGMKGQILEGLGRIGSPSSLPFLTERLNESYQSLRISAAAALLECLYH